MQCQDRGRSAMARTLSTGSAIYPKDFDQKIIEKIKANCHFALSIHQRRTQVKKEAWEEDIRERRVNHHRTRSSTTIEH